jgi:hypothetical protein
MILTVLMNMGACLAAAQSAPQTSPAGAQVENPSLVSPEEKWEFIPNEQRAGDKDPFFDLEQVIDVRNRMSQQGGGTPLAVATKAGVDNNFATAIERARKDAEQIEALIVQRKWDEGLKVCDGTIKNLQRYRDTDEAKALLEKIERFRSQIEEAKLYQEALASFSALDLRIEGILWSPEGSLAVIRGEPRARGVNERVKECLVLTIDTNRVDFLYHYKMRRYEFQRYVGEDIKSQSSSTPAKPTK